MGNAIGITDVYENAVNTLHTMNPYEQSVIANNIAQLEYIDDLIKRKNSKRTFEALVNEIAAQIYKKTAIVDIMQMSAIYYKGKKAGFDVSRLHRAMHNNGDWLMSEQNKIMKI
jgi:hypothetical protein